jgi:hypothetical protein
MILVKHKIKIVIAFETATLIVSKEDAPSQPKRRFLYAVDDAFEKCISSESPS